MAALDHRTVWRWHFYAGLFCIPFVLWLSVTGTIFLFHPQIQHWLDRAYNHLDTEGPAASANAQVQAALATVPGSTLAAYQLPYDGHSPAQVLIDKGPAEYRVYVHPRTAQVLKTDNEDYRVDTFMSRLHGELLIGKYGSWIVELAASWAVVMVVTGLFLWWPRSAKGLAGIVYPRLFQGKRLFWRDLHAVTGIYVSFFALFLLFTGLPWAASWGAYLKAARQLGLGHSVKQDWTTTSAETIAARTAPVGAHDMANMSAHDMANMSAHDMANMKDMPGMAGMSAPGPARPGGRRRRGAAASSGNDSYAAIDTMVATVAPLRLANPVMIAPPSEPGGNWAAKSDTRNRPLRVNLELDAQTGAILQRTDFHTKPWIDRVVGTGVAAHEGQLFGLANQFLGLFTTCGLVLLSVSGLVMWRRRRPEGVLGAPAATRKVRFTPVLIAFMVAFGLYMPFLGASMLLVALAERLIFRRIPAAQRWLGLYQAPA